MNLESDDIKDIKWSLLKEKNNIIKLRSSSYALLYHKDFENIISVTWMHSDLKLLFSKITNAQFPYDKFFIFDLIKYNYIILNPDIEGYEILIKLNVNHETKIIECSIIKQSIRDDLEINFIQK